MGLGLSGVVLAIAGLVGNPLGGWLSDRFGARDALVGGLMVAAAGALAMAGVRSPAGAFRAAALIGLGAAIVWPAQDALLATVVSPAQRSGVFSIRHATLNAGLGVGSLVSALIVDVARPATFQAIYVLDAASFAASIPVLLCVRLRRRAAQRKGEAACRGGYRQVWRDKVFLRVWGLTALLIGAGYAQIHAALPAFSTGPGRISPRSLGVAFAANTATVVVAQLLVVRLLAGRRRTRVVMALCGLWAAAWGLTLVAGGMGGGLGGSVAFVMALVVFGLGETFLAPMVNDLAPDHLRGHYNGASTLAWTGGFIAGPLFAGAALGAGRSHLLFGGLVVACAGAAVLALRLERRLPASVNVVGSGVVTEAVPHASAGPVPDASGAA